MTLSELTDRPIYSQFGDDPDLGELVEMFVSEMPDRIDTLTQLRQLSDWEGVGRIAHQLKGAAGSYGFDEVTPFAACLESLAKEGAAEDEIHVALGQLVGICRRLKEGSPG